MRPKSAPYAGPRIGLRTGIVAFVTNGKFVNGNTADGLRKALLDEASFLYVFNLRGDQHTAGERSRQEGSKIFGSGSRNGIVIMMMIKDSAHKGPGELHYCDIGDYLSREDKLVKIEGFGSIEGVPWHRIVPNAAGDWINLQSPRFEGFRPMGVKEGSKDSVFGIYSAGLADQPRSLGLQFLGRSCRDQHARHD